MSRTIGVVDYGSTGNIESIRKALVAAGAQVRIIDDARNLSGADKLVLPGVGSFAEAMRQVRERGMFDPLISAAASTPILGICLGMQMLARVGYEFGETSGFGLIDGEVRPVVCKAAIPHIGFKQIRKIGDSPLFRGLASDAEFYFMHSYEFVNYTDVAGLTTHGEHQFVSAVAKSHLFGVQFHPEKSRDAGIRLLKNFVEL